MIKVDIKEISSPDAFIGDPAIEKRPDVFLLVQVGLAERGSNTLDIFYFMAATPEGLQQHSKSHPIIKRNLIVFHSFSWGLLREVIEDIVQESASETWNETLAKLQRYFQWEYEDYIRDH